MWLVKIKFEFVEFRVQFMDCEEFDDEILQGLFEEFVKFECVVFKMGNS